MNTFLMAAVRAQIVASGGLRAAARKLHCDPSYLMKLRDGTKDNPSSAFLKKLGLRRIVTVKFELI